jgi:hypothetical protein
MMRDDLLVGQGRNRFDIAQLARRLGDPGAPTSLAEDRPHRIAMDACTIYCATIRDRLAGGDWVG